MTEPVETERRGRGRPTLFSEERAELVLGNLAAGKSWGEVEEIAGVSVRSVMRWADERPDFAAELDRARRSAAEVYAADDPLRHEADPQRARVRLERAKWLASKWNPERYGDRMAIDLRHEIDIRAALDAAQGRVVAGVAVETGSAPPTARLGTSGVSATYPELDDVPAGEPDFMR